MAFFSFSIFSSLFFLLSSSASACDRCRHHAQAAHSSAFSQLLPRGACGYGAMAMELNGGFLASGAPQIHRGGLGCGRCFQMRCKDAKVCSTGGVRVVLTDLYRNNRTDFLLNGPAFVGLARPGMAQELKRLGPVPIEYKRIPCDYKNKNLSILVEDQSKMPNNLVIKFLHQGGQTDILAVDVAQVGSSDWRLMSRVYGPVWSTSRAPAGPLQFRLVVTGGYDGKWVWADREVLPAKWRPGQPYDTGIQIADVARESCLECDTQDWK